MFLYSLVPYSGNTIPAVNFSTCEMVSNNSLSVHCRNAVYAHNIQFVKFHGGCLKLVIKIPPWLCIRCRFNEGKLNAILRLCSHMLLNKISRIFYQKLSTLLFLVQCGNDINYVLRNPSLLQWVSKSAVDHAARTLDAPSSIYASHMYCSEVGCCRITYSKQGLSDVKGRA